jgi:hypothetical protein
VKPATHHAVLTLRMLAPISPCPAYLHSFCLVKHGDIIAVVIIIVTLFVFTFLQGIYNYIPETTHVSMIYIVAAVLQLRSVLHVMFFDMLNMFCTSTSALSAVCVCVCVCVCAVPYMAIFLLQFLNFMLSWYFAQLLSE